MACGAALTASCPSCGTAAPAGARFCMACGTALAGAPAAHGPRRRRPRARSGARSRSCSPTSSGYTSVAERLDHETVKTLIERCLTRLRRGGGALRRARRQVHRRQRDGRVRRSRGARGRRRARGAGGVRDAGRDGRAQRRHLAPSSASSSRCASASTPARCSPAGSATPTRCSATPSTSPRGCSRLRRWGASLVGERTQRLSDKAIDYRELEPLELKGKAEPRGGMGGARIRRAGRPRRRRAARGAADRARRGAARLKGLFERVAAGARPAPGHVVGQAGVGKSRLLAELERTLGEG